MYFLQFRDNAHIQVAIVYQFDHAHRVTRNMRHRNLHNYRIPKGSITPQYDLSKSIAQKCSLTMLRLLS